MLLERAVLTQPNSRYELAAEYVLPPGFVVPSRIADAQQVAAAALAPPGEQQQQQAADEEAAQHQHHGSGGRHRGKHGHRGKHHHHREQQAAAAQAAAAAAASPEGGRWRLQLTVPQAAVEELLPAGQLLRRAARRSARDYSLAKQHFLGGLATAAINAGEEFSSQVPPVGLRLLAASLRAGCLRRVPSLLLPLLNVPACTAATAAAATCRLLHLPRQQLLQPQPPLQRPASPPPPRPARPAGCPPACPACRSCAAAGAAG